MLRLSSSLRHLAILRFHLLIHSEAVSIPKFDGPTQPDWNNRDPLYADGTNFPCKLYHRDLPWRITKSVISGEEYELLLDGTATHRGGPCQLSLSYDDGVTFRVIKSIEGRCTLTQRYNFRIPAAAAGADAALLSWTWFKREGNREMSQNCIPIRIFGPESTNPANSIAHLPRLPVISIMVAERSSIGGFAFRILGVFSRKAMIKIEMVPLFSGKDVREREAEILRLVDGGDSIQEVLKDGQEENGEAWKL